MVVIENIQQFHRNLREWTDPRVKTLPLMASPVPTIIIVVLYINFVFKLGPQIMSNRKPLQLNRILNVYNLMQIFLNIIGVCSVIYYIPKLNLICMPILDATDLAGQFEANFHYFYLILKIIDLLDTVFFILRKKNTQITFLHVYHHTGLVVLSWISCNFYPGGQLIYSGGLNCFTHVVMYFYYFITSLDTSQTKKVWWKKYLTQLQILQHGLILLTMVFSLLNRQCNYPKGLLVFLISAVGALTYLFIKFYIKTYINKKKTQNFANGSLKLN